MSVWVRDFACLLARSLARVPARLASLWLGAIKAQANEVHMGLVVVLARPLNCLVKARASVC